jgi:two-component system chemotaxis sensor kinase CheA
VDPKRLKYLAVFKQECEEHLRALADHLLALERTPGEAEPLKQAMRVAHTLKGSAQLLGLSEIAKEAHAIEDHLRRIERGEPLDTEMTDALLRAVDAIRARVADLLPAPRTAAPPPPPPQVEAEPSGGALAQPAPAQPLPVPQGPQPGRAGQTIRVAVEKVDGLLGAAGELSLGRARLERLVTEVRGLLARMKNRAGDPQVQELRRLYEGLSQAVGEIDLSVRDVQDLTLSMRLLPCSTLFGDYPRAVRDLGRELGKEVRVLLYGGETECDKDLLDAVREPLVHLLRNCVDHGIESADERRGAGKPPHGTITVRASQRGATLTIEVADDGRGIDLNAVKTQAVRLGHLSAEQAAKMTDSEAAYLITASGLTTRQSATSTSGRGIGMDVVSATITALKGDLVIETDSGRGTRYLLSLPISLATMKVLLVDCERRVYAIPLASVELTLRVDPEEQPTLAESGTLLVRGQTVRLVWLRGMLGIETPPIEAGQRLSVVIVRHGGQSLGLVTDQLVRDDEVVIKPLPMSQEVSPYVSGATLLGDGQLAMILAIPRIFAATGERANEAALAPPPVVSQAPIVKKKVLVVDDSFTTRLLEQNILEGSGYAVDVAVSGEAALSLLTEQSYDLMVTDVQMPGMSGFDLIEAVRRDPQHGGMPCIVVSSMGSPEEREHGRKAGAQAYIVKGDFEQETLLQAVEQLIGR